VPLGYPPTLSAVMPQNPPLQAGCDIIEKWNRWAWPWSLGYPLHPRGLPTPDTGVHPAGRSLWHQPERAADPGRLADAEGFRYSHRECSEFSARGGGCGEGDYGLPNPGTRRVVADAILPLVR
jgi:hypothetical protein